jgi:hypothetical protein
MSRKAISKKLRFDVFKRDGFQCVYCGKTPPEITLEVDHIEPVSEGGTNDINNLVSACFDCNRGKGKLPLNKKIPVKLLENLETLKEKEEQLTEYRKFIKKIKRRENKDISDINKIYVKHYEEWELSTSFRQTSLKKFLSLLPKHEVKEAMHLAINKFPENSNRTIKYFCGVCWRKIKSDLPKL